MLALLVAVITNLFTDVLPAGWGWSRDWHFLGLTLLVLGLLAAWSAAAGVGHRAERAGEPPPPDDGLRKPLGQDSARLLGVRQAIQVPGCSDLPLPYVPRSVDGDLRTAVRAAAEGGQFVVLQGNLATGKTRTLLEAVRGALAESDEDWEICCPADVAAVRALPGTVGGRLVVWLDRLERYLDQDDPLSVDTVRDLMHAKMVVVGTLSDYETRISVRPDDAADMDDNDREVLRLAEVFHLPDELSSAERRQARKYAADERIRIALDSVDAGFVQVLAAGPQLAQWDQPVVGERPDRAVGAAAFDAWRLGARYPLPKQYLREAARAYLTGGQRARIDQAGWFADALARATTATGATSPVVSPVAVAMGRPVGYLPTDYLRQYVSSRWRAEPVKDEVWAALIRHHRRQDTFRLAESAERRGRLRDAETLYRRLADTGDRLAAERLADLLARQGRTGEAIALCRAHRYGVCWQIRLADLLAGQGDIDAAIETVRPYAADRTAALRLAELFAAQGRGTDAVDVLWLHAGDPAVGPRLLDLLAAQGRRDDALAAVRPHAIDGPTAVSTAAMLEDQGWPPEALDVLAPHLDGADGAALIRTAELLVEDDRQAAAEELLRRGAGGGNAYVAAWLADLLSSWRRYDDARAVLLPYAADDGYAAELLAEVHLAQGDLDGAVAVLGWRADRDEYVAVRLANLLFGHGGKDEALALLHRHTADGDGHAARRLAELLVECGREQEAIDVLRQHSRDRNCADLLADLLADRRGRRGDHGARGARSFG